MERNVLLQISDRGDIRLYDRRDSFSACFKKGQWFDHLVFNAYELEDFNLINDQNEIDQVLAEARAALGKPLSLDGETI